MIRSIQLLFFPKAFVNAEIEHLRKLNSEGEVCGNPEDFRPDAEHRLAKKRKGKLFSFLFVAIFFCVGYAISYAANHWFPVSADVISFLRASSMLVLAWAVLGRIGYETQTMSGETLLEITSERLFKQLYGVGLCIGFATLYLQPA